jgi:FMN phosphatase YigB (HAD superfamily)
MASRASSIAPLVVFDLGGVMVDLAQGWQETLVKAGVRYRPFDTPPEFWASYTVLEHGLENGTLAPDDYFHGIQTLIGGDYTLDELRAGFMAILQGEFPGIAAIVAGLQAQGVRTACLSNTSPLHWPILTDPARYPSVAALDVHVASHRVGLCKPDPTIYRTFEAITGAPPEAMLFFDDRPVNTAGARAAGWRAVDISWSAPAAAQIRAGLAAELGLHV